ncbi:MAG: hypothetical protein HQ564_04890 [Candidatus Saganbacteria bacterium]|nr:hypothetical protein [Candidatus Saganbacteria bacterium]
MIVLLLSLVLLSSASFAAGISAVSVDVEGMPYVRLALNKAQSVDLGVMYVSTAAVATTTIVGRFNSKLFDLSKSANAFWGASVGIASAAASTTTINGFVGAEVMLTPNLAGYARVNLVSLVSTGGASTTTLMGGSAVSYSGLTLYL